MRKKQFTVNKRQAVKMGAVFSLAVCMALGAVGCGSTGAGKESTTASAPADTSAASDSADQSSSMDETTTAADETTTGMSDTTAAVGDTTAGSGDTTDAAASAKAASDGTTASDQTTASTDSKTSGETTQAAKDTTGADKTAKDTAKVSDGDSGTTPKPGAPLKEGNKAPDFTATLIDGKTVKLSDLKGKPTLINFWATWCGPCVGEMSAFQRLEKDYGDKINILAVNSGEDADTVKDFIKSNNYTFPVALDENYDIATLYPTNGIPYTVVVDANGKITHVSTGALDADTMYQRYKEALGL